MARLSFIISLILLLSGCAWTRDPEKNRYSLYRQRIENSNFALYEFSYFGEFAFSSDYVGITILDTAATFSRNKIEDILPYSYYFSTKPKLGSLKMVALEFSQTQEQDTLQEPVGQFTETFNGVAFDILKYRTTYGSASMSTGLMKYEFDNLHETKDSLVFHHVTREYGGKVFQDTASFLKGNIKVSEDADGRILYIEVKQLVIERGNIYKPTSPLELVPNRPIVGFAIYRFHPRMQINADLLTDYGIWKRVK